MHRAGHLPVSISTHIPWRLMETVRQTAWCSSDTHLPSNCLTDSIKLQNLDSKRIQLNRFAKASWSSSPSLSELSGGALRFFPSHNANSHTVETGMILSHFEKSSWQNAITDCGPSKSQSVIHNLCDSSRDSQTDRRTIERRRSGSWESKKQKGFLETTLSTNTHC